MSGRINLGVKLPEHEVLSVKHLDTDGGATCCEIRELLRDRGLLILVTGLPIFIMCVIGLQLLKKKNHTSLVKDIKRNSQEKLKLL